MRYKLFLLLTFALFLSTTAPVHAQTPEEEVRAVIDQLFDGMRAGDSTVVRSVFHESAGLATTLTREGMPELHHATVDQFAESVGTPHEKTYDERIWDVDIKVDDNLATAWMNYAFFLGDQLSHCGVNSFELFRSAEGWKIIYIVDTRRQAGCEVPDDLR